MERLDSLLDERDALEIREGTAQARCWRRLKSWIVRAGRRDGQRCAMSCADIGDTVTDHGVSVGDIVGGDSGRGGG